MTRHHSRMSSPGRDEHGNGGRAVCPICYEDLKPVAEGLQSISVCGHVFHELCLHQWQEYCPRGKKCACPVCKQSYISRDVIRLFFQSTGGSTNDCASVCTQKSQPEPEEIRKLQGKISALSSALDAQKQRVSELNSEITAWKNRAEREEESKMEHQKEKEIIRQLLQRKEADLCKSSEDCAKFKEKSIALAKELSTLKLAMDVNLREEEMDKLVAIGGGTTADAIDVLQRSLFLRNKCYKELMSQCNSLGRAETRALKKLEKSEEKIKMLKARLQELEKGVEKNDSQMLRALKVSNQKSPEHGQCENFRHTCSLEANADYSANQSSLLHMGSSHIMDDTINMIPSFKCTEVSAVDYFGSTFPMSVIDSKDTRKYSKWGRTPSEGNPSMQASKCCGGLIALGADGRGGTVKVLRGLDKLPESKARPLLSKQFKRQRTLSVQTQSRSGIEQYFGKTRM